MKKTSESQSNYSDNLTQVLETPELQNYFRGIELLAETKSTDIFRNAGDAHAVVVFYHIFKNSKSTVRILAKNLCNVVTQSKLYRDALISFLSNGKSTLQLLLEETGVDALDKKQEDSIFKFLLPYRDQITIKKTDKKIKRGTAEEIHMCIGDNSMYRIETDTKNRHAEGCFNDSEYVSILIQEFDKLFNSATDVKYSELLQWN